MGGENLSAPDELDGIPFGPLHKTRRMLELQSFLADAYGDACLLLHAVH